MNIHEIEEYAKNNGFDSVKFIIKINGRKFEGKFLDAYLGMINIPSIKEDGFIMLNSIRVFDPVFTVIE